MRKKKLLLAAAALALMTAGGAWAGEDLVALLGEGAWTEEKEEKLAEVDDMDKLLKIIKKRMGVDDDTN